MFSRLPDLDRNKTPPILLGLETPSRFEESRKRNIADRERAKNFKTTLDLLLAEENKVSALQRYLFNEGNLNRLNSSELMQIYTSFRSLKSFDNMIRMFDESDNLTFKKSGIVREFYAVSCNMTGAYGKTIETANGLIEDNLINGEVYAALGKAYLKRHDIAMEYSNIAQDKNIDPDKQAAARLAYQQQFPRDISLSRAHENARESLENSKKFYEMGFLNSFEYYPGINTAYRLIELGEYDKAQKVAKLVHHCCLREGGRETMDYWCATTLVEATCITSTNKEDVEKAMASFSRIKDIEPWQLDSTLQMLGRLKNTLDAKGLSTENFEYAIKKIEEMKTSSAYEVSSDHEPNLLDAVRGVSFSYRGLASNFVGANFVAGNTRYGGQLPDHCITRTDWQQFEELLRTPLKNLLGNNLPANYPATLSEVTDLDKFLEISDRVIRESFNTDSHQLEDLHSTGHKRYDQTVKSLLHLGAIDKGSDTRTNISTIMALGLGDCRHHAQAKQILFDSWQRMHSNASLRKAYAALMEGDTRKYERHLEAAERIESVEMRTFDVVVQAPIQMDGKYNIRKDKNGLPLVQPDGSIKDVEDHTLNIIVEHNKNGNLVKMRFADSFYQNTYPWGSGSISLEDIRMDEDKNLVLPAKRILCVDPDNGRTYEQSVQMTPTKYAGKREKIANDEHGQILLLGSPIQGNFSLSEVLDHKNRKNRSILLDRIFIGAASAQSVNIEERVKNGRTVSTSLQSP